MGRFSYIASLTIAGNIPFEVSRVWDEAGNRQVQAVVTQNDITSGGQVNHYTGLLNIIPNGGKQIIDTKFRDVYEDSFTRAQKLAYSQGTDLLALDRGIDSAYDPVGDVTDQIVTTAAQGGGGVTITYTYTDSVGRIFKAERKLSVVTHTSFQHMVKCINYQT